MRFRDRRDAGRHLAKRLEDHRGGDALVLALPRGGVPVAHEVARALGAPLDVVVARKLGAPQQPEYGVGAIAPGGVRVLDAAAVDAMGVGDAALEEVIGRERAELRRRLRRYRGDRPFPPVEGRTVIVVDDGLATGVTARAALAYLKARRPGRLVLAVPVCAPDAAAALRDHADEVVCVASPADFRAVGAWYDDFEQTTDEEVATLLEAARERATPAAGAGGRA